MRISRSFLCVLFYKFMRISWYQKKGVINFGLHDS
nr:MAG TPA: hypothetical protein [Caudoviricetes sp.]